MLAGVLCDELVESSLRVSAGFECLGVVRDAWRGHALCPLQPLNI
jgi:hypothetical protein